jgi:MFS family permease
MRESNRSALVGFFASHGLGRALRHRTFALYTLFSWFSTVSFWMQRIGVQWLAWELTHSYSWLGMIALGEALAAFLVTPVAGFVADRHDRVRLAVVSQGGLFLLSLTLAALAWSGLLSIYVLLALTTLTGIVDGFWAPVRIAIVPRLVPRADMGPAFSVGATMFNISQFVGPALAGWLIAHFAMGQVFAMAGLGYFAFTLSLLTMGLKAEEPGTGRGPSRGVLRDVREGLAYVLSQPALRLVMATLFVVAFCYRPYREHLAGLADAVLGVGPEGLATLASA